MSSDRFAASSRAVSVGGAGIPFPRLTLGLTRTASTGGPGGPTRERTRSKRGEKGNESNKVGNTSQSQVTANRWDTRLMQTHPRWPIGRSRIC